VSFLDLKTRTRRDVHSRFAVPCTVATGSRGGSGDVPLTARFHNKMALGGDILSEGYANIIEGIQRVIFNREEFVTAVNGGQLTLSRGDVVTFPNYMGPNQDLVVVLDARDPHDGPIDEKWSVGPA